MGNCQAAEAATVVIEHPEGRIDRFYWSLSACHVMAANPGHYVAAVIVTTAASSSSTTSSNTVKHLKLLRPNDTLLIGRVYRLITFEEVLREFASKRLAVKLRGDDGATRQVKNNGSSDGDNGRRKRVHMRGQGRAPATTHEQAAMAVTVASEEPSAAEPGAEGTAVARGGRRQQGHQWRPALESIAETAAGS